MSEKTFIVFWYKKTTETIKKKQMELKFTTPSYRNLGCGNSPLINQPHCIDSIKRENEIKVFVSILRMLKVNNSYSYQIFS